MSVQLMGPYTRGCAAPGGVALDRGPRFVRTRAMSRWHRVRYGIDFGSHRAFGAWCGQSVFDSSSRPQFLGRDRDPVDGIPICGTCEGRALGAGHDRNDGPRDLLFSPYPRVPRWCPGSNRALYRPHDDPRGWPRVGTCLVCSAVEPIRASSRGYAYGNVGLRKHEALELIDPCPFHAWQYLAVLGDAVVCDPCTRSQRAAS